MPIRPQMTNQIITDLAGKAAESVAHRAVVHNFDGSDSLKLFHATYQAVRDALQAIYIAPETPAESEATFEEEPVS